MLIPSESVGLRSPSDAATPPPHPHCIVSYESSQRIKKFTDQKMLGIHKRKDSEVPSVMQMPAGNINANMQIETH
jgi:hypothetical protein